MIANLGSKWLQKTKVFDCKNLLVYFCDCKLKKKKNWISVRFQLFGVRDCNNVLHVIAL
jgi:hypothetical protein